MTARSKSYVCSIAQACQTIDTFASYGFGGRSAPEPMITIGRRAAVALGLPPAGQSSATYPAWMP
jgi:hypothetical protein